MSLLGPLSPFLAAGDQLKLDRALGAQHEVGTAVDRLAPTGMMTPTAFLQRRANFGLGDDLREMGRGDFLLAFRDEHEVDR